MDKEICTISLGNGGLDNDFTFYESEKIKRYYDSSIWSLNNEEWLNARDISIERKKELIKKCPEEFVEIVTKILDSTT